MGKSRKSTRLTAAACASALELLEQRAMFSVAEPNNTFATAVAVNDGRAAGGSFTFTDFINDADPVDFFRLTNRGAPSHFGVGLRDPDGDLSLSLISDTNGNGVEDAGDQVITSANGGTLNETIQANLIPG